jgi:hypothetical protein
MCHMCFRSFKTYTDQEIHKAKPCYMDIHAPDVKQPIQVSFAAKQLFYIGDALAALQIPVVVPAATEHGDDDGNGQNKSLLQCSIVVDHADLEITLRRLYMAQITKFNLEQWYPALFAKGEALQDELTARTIFRELTETELKLLMALASINLAQNLGMSSHETNAELAAKEAFEDELTQLMGGLDNKKPFFVRLSTRSPKDGVVTSVDVKDGDLLTSMTAKLNTLQVLNPNNPHYPNIGPHIPYK